MGLKEILASIGHRITNRPTETFDDNETRDKHLRSLRRERRIQLEQIEKRRLIHTINNFKKQERRKNLYGIGDNILRTKANLMKKQRRKHGPKYF